MAPPRYTLRLLDPSAARRPTARTSATFLGERPRSAPPVWWERGGLLERLRSDSGFSQERARPGSTAPRRLSLLSHQDSSISRFHRFPCGLCAKNFFFRRVGVFSSCFRSWASGVKPALSSRCRFSLALAAPGGAWILSSSSRSTFIACVLFLFLSVCSCSVAFPGRPGFAAVGSKCSEVSSSPNLGDLSG